MAALILILFLVSYGIYGTTMPSRHLLGTYRIWKVDDAPRSVVLSSGSIEVFDPASQNYQALPVLNLVVNLGGQKNIGTPRVGRFSSIEDGVFRIRQKV